MDDRDGTFETDGMRRRRREDDEPRLIDQDGAEELIAQAVSRVWSCSASTVCSGG
jgi:hypothetical protein